MLSLRSILAEFAAGCRDLSGAVCRPFEPNSASHGDEPLRRSYPDDWLPGRPAAATGAVGLLLHDRMKFMHIDRDEFASAEPAVMRHLTICCVRCGSTRDCARDLADTLPGLLGGEWRDYCPNAAILCTISALRAAGIPSVPPAISLVTADSHTDSRTRAAAS